MTRNAVRILNRALPLWTLVLLIRVFFVTPADGATNAQTFTYQGRFTNEAGTAPLSGLIDITFSIYDPAVACLLYQETQTNVDLTSTSGVFSAQVGSNLGASKRTAGDPALSMAQIFANNIQIRAAASPHCAPGYTPAAGDSRVLRVTVLPHSTGTPVTISPDQTINSVPQAQTAETLQGLAPQSFVQSAAGVSGQANVSLATLETLTGGTDASTLHNHDSLYVKIGVSGTSANLGTGAYTTGSSFGIGTTNPTGNLSFTGSSGAQTITVNRDTVAGSSGSNLAISAGGATLGATNQNGGNLVLSGGVSTGTGSSSIQFQTTSSGSTGSGDNNPSTRMTLTSTGELGIGASSPGAQLEVDTSGAAILAEILKGSASQTGDLLEFQNSSGTVLSKFDASGFLTLPGSPTSALQAATKQYVDSAIAGGTAGVASFNTRTGAVTLSSADVTGALTYTPLKNSTDTMTGNLTIDQILSVGGAVGANTQFQSTSTATTNATAVLKEFSGQTADILDLENNSGTVLSKFDSAGMLTLQANPTSTLQAATKSYVDSAVSSITGFLPLSGGTMSGAVSGITTLATTSNMSVGGTLGVSGATTLANFTSGGSFTENGISAPSVSASGKGTLYFDSTAGAFEISQSGGAYSPIATTGNLGNYLPLAGGTTTGVTLIPSGSLSAPALAFSASTGTGIIYNSGLNALTIAVGTGDIIDIRTSVVQNQQPVEFNGNNGGLAASVGHAANTSLKMGVNGYLTQLSNTTATSSANYSSPIYTSQGNYYNGTASAADAWTMQDVLGSGTNPTSTLTFGHSGTSGSTYYNFQNGNVGINNATPSYPLDVTGGARATSFAMTSAPTASATTSSVALGSAIVGGNVQGTYIGTNAASGYTGDYENFQVNGTSEFKVDGSGNVTAAAYYGDGTHLTQTGTRVLSCEPGLGDGLNAMAAGTYLQSTCWNKTGATWTLTAIQCFTDNSGTSTMSATNGTGTALLTGAVTCSSSLASGTQGTTVTIANGDFIKFTFVSDGTSKQTTWVVSGTY
jgi:fibronectin-binding autotransporter adhesin